MRGRERRRAELTVCASAVESEKFLCRFGRGFSDFLERNAARGCDRFGDQPGVRWFAAFPSERYRGQVRTIGFNHELPKRNGRRHVANVGAVFKRHNTGEGNEVIELNDLVRLFDGPAKTVEYSPHFASVWPHDLEGVVPCVALVDDNIQSQFD